ncbi:hypothetical protein AALA90_05115 [Lachnospiraceae bacterium 38-10]
MDRTKSTKSELYFHQAVNAVLLAGLIILFIGAYYCVVKAGIPYQDAPQELQIQYAVNMGIGEVLVKKGFLIFVSAGIVQLLFKSMLKKRQRE